MYLLAVRGKLMVENKRSDIAKLMTNIVVAWHRSFGHLSNATTVKRFPENENKGWHLYYLYHGSYLYLLIEDFVISFCLLKSLNS